MRSKSAHDPIEVTCTYFDGIRPEPINAQDMPWARFVSDALPALLANERRDKKRLPGFVLAEVDGKRDDDHTGAHTALAIDVDALPDNDLGALQKRASRFLCALYETASSTDDAPRVRVVVALPTPIPPAHVPEQRRALAVALGLDPATCGTDGALPTSQVMFCGRLKGTRERGLWTYEGEIWTPPRPDRGASQGRRRAPRVDARHDLAGPPVGSFAFDTPPDLSAIARAVPPPGVDGDRHMLVRALGGWLARRGHSPDMIAEAVREQIPSECPAERAAQAKDAAERALVGEEAPGWEALQRWSSAYGRKSTLKRLEEACRDPGEPDGFGEPWSAAWQRQWPIDAAYWHKRGAKARAASASGVRSRNSEAARAERREGALAELAERAGPEVAAALETDTEGQPYSHAANVALAVRHYVGHAVARNAATGRVYVTEAVTLAAGPVDVALEVGLWSDVHTTRLHGAVCQLGLKRPSRGDVDHAVEAVAAERPYWPVRQYLDGLPAWDGVDRSLCTYLGVVRTEYTEWVCAAWLRSCVARGMVPGCQVDHVLVLEGPQGTAKSTALRDLAGGDGDWFGEFTANPRDSKAVGEQLQGKWIVEIAELDRYTRLYSESEIKSVVTRRVDDYRTAYGRHAEPRPRTAAAAASTNRGEYLTDYTGNRRYWPIVTGEIDLDALRTDREQVWAQALSEYRDGVPWWPATAELKALVRTEQATRLVTDGWGKAIRAWVRSLDVAKPFHVEDAFVEAVPMALERVDGKARDRVERCLLALGCVRTDTKRGRAWLRPQKR